MIKIKNIDSWGFQHAIRGMRNPMNSWDKSDSGYPYVSIIENGLPTFGIGENDISLMKKLYRAGTEHRKYLRQIMVSMDITAPLYWWKQFDQYKIGVTSNSCSTMHKIHEKEFLMDDFSFNDSKDMDAIYFECMLEILGVLNEARKQYLATTSKKYWWMMVKLLPNSYNQTRTVTMNYENVVSIIKQRNKHKLDEWKDFIKHLEELPYIKDIMEG